MKIVSFSDHPAAQSGLARIHRDLAIRIHQMPEFEIATLGYGSPGSTRLPFPQYSWKENGYFIPTELPFIAQDFANNEPFIFFTIGDIQRFLPLADPQFCPDQGFAGWWKERRSTGTKLWGYFPIDAHGIGGKLPPQLAHTLTHYDRVLVPSQWAKSIVQKTLPALEVKAIPHGIDTDIFKPHDKWESREKIGEILDPVIQWPKDPIDVHPDALWIGIVATNQWRKDWGLGIEVVAEIKKTRPVFLWAHTDRLKQDQGWSILELLSEFGLLGCSMLTMGNVSDETMAVAYSAMDITLGIGRGEGFGYPIFESIFCGTPCFAYDYGAQVDYVDRPHCFDYEYLRIEGPLGLLRPCPTVGMVTAKIIRDIGSEMRYPEELEWKNVWPRFEKWFREGL